MSKPIVIALGEILWDMLPTGKRAGGAPVNFAYHASQNGAESYAISAVGNDELGAELLNDAHKAGINTLVQTNEYPTGTVAVALTNGIPEYTIVQNVAWDHIGYTDELAEAVSKADAICFVAKSWDYHVRVALETTLEENLAAMRDSIRAARAQGREVLIDCEHFFDGYAENAEYALETLRAAARGAEKSESG